METRNLITAVLAAMLVMVLYTTIYRYLNPVPEQPPTATAPAAPAAGDTPPATSAPSTTPEASVTPTETAPTTSATSPAQSRPAAAFVGGESQAEIVLGGGPESKIAVYLNPLGAAIDRIELTARDKDGQYIHRAERETNEPYTLIQPVETESGLYRSYYTRRIWIGKQSWSLDDLVWRVVEQDAEHVTFAATLQATDGTDAEKLRVLKTYRLPADSAAMTLDVDIENPGGEQIEITVEQDGPLGVTKENRQYEMRRLIVVQVTEGSLEPSAFNRGKLKPKPDPDTGEPTMKELGSSEKGFFWTALANKYFAVYTRPLASDGRTVDYLGKVGGTLVTDNGDDQGDYLARFVTKPQKVAAGSDFVMRFEIFNCSKNAEDLEAVNPAYIDRSKVGYIAASDADARCCCAPPALTRFMIWLLDVISSVVHNYGVAIIILVLIIRVLLHPLAVFQQKSMYRMQEAQVRLQPKMADIKEKFANDKVKQNQEMMRLYSEEGVNPMAPMIGMLPMMLQMPILIAMWTAVNTDVHLRHQAFLPVWITDLSAPDALIHFGDGGFTIPVLGQMLPFLFAHIPSLNLLPILMGVSMWLQQKYMPKPGMKAKLDAARVSATEKKPVAGPGGMSPQDQMKQQQMMAYMMSIMFPLMFYKMPSGLNLYWMATNVVGILESLRVRKQLDSEKKKREALGPVPKKEPGAIGRAVSGWFKRMAAQAEELQRKADELAKDGKGGKGGKKDR